MPKKSSMTGSGFAPLQASVLCGPGDQALTATGSSSSDALTINSHHNAVSTVGSGTGVIFSTTFSAGDWAYVYNGGANTLTIYPPSGSTIDNTTSATIATKKGILFFWGTDTAIVSHKST